MNHFMNKITKEILDANKVNNTGNGLHGPLLIVYQTVKKNPNCTSERLYEILQSQLFSNVSEIEFCLEGLIRINLVTKDGDRYQ